VRQRRLESLGDRPDAHGEVVGRRTQHRDVPERHGLRVELRLREEPQLPHGGRQIQRLIVDARVERLGVDHRHGGRQQGGLPRDRVRCGVKRQAFGGRGEQVRTDGLERGRDHRRIGRVVGGDLVGPDPGSLVVIQRTEQESAVRCEVLGLIELTERRHQGQPAAGEVGAREVPMQRVTPAVLEIESPAVQPVDDRLRRAHAGDVRHQGRGRDGVVIRAASDLGGEVGIGVVGREGAGRDEGVGFESAAAACVGLGVGSGSAAAACVGVGVGFGSPATARVGHGRRRPAHRRTARVAAGVGHRGIGTNAGTVAGRDQPRQRDQRGDEGSSGRGAPGPRGHRCTSTVRL
jgi:hypothetical protein